MIYLFFHSKKCRNPDDKDKTYQKSDFNYQKFTKTTEVIPPPKTELMVLFVAKFDAQF